MKVAPPATAFLLVLLPVLVYAVTPQRYPYQSCFEVAAELHSVPLDLILAVAATESNWEPGARSEANAHGIMQIQWPGTAKHLGVKRVGELYNPCLNISLGARYLSELIVSFDASVERALAAYNYGPTRIRKSPDLPLGAKNYANKVMAHRQQIASGLLPANVQKLGKKSLVVFDSKIKASRLAALLGARIQAKVHVATVEKPLSGYAVIIEFGEEGLTVTDHVLLQNMGWSF